MRKSAGQALAGTGRSLYHQRWANLMPRSCILSGLFRYSLRRVNWCSICRANRKSASFESEMI